MERRRNLRGPAQFDEVLYAGGQVAGYGVLSELSKSGARVDEVSIPPPVGTQVRVSVFVEPDKPFELVGCVVRLARTGFAIEFSDLSDECRDVVDALTAMTSVVGQDESQSLPVTLDLFITSSRQLHAHQNSEATFVARR